MSLALCSKEQQQPSVRRPSSARHSHSGSRPDRDGWTGAVCVRDGKSTCTVLARVARGIQLLLIHTWRDRSAHAASCRHECRHILSIRYIAVSLSIESLAISLSILSAVSFDLWLVRLRPDSRPTSKQASDSRRSRLSRSRLSSPPHPSQPPRWPTSHPPPFMRLNSP